MSKISHSNFLKILNCFTILPNWDEEPFVHSFTQNLYLFMNNPENIKRHYEFLRYIIYDLCNHVNDKKYMDFLHIVLFTLFEENSISLEHKVVPNEKLYSILTLPDIKYIFDEKGEIRDSNTRITMLIDLLNEQPSICNSIKQEIDSKSYKAPSTTNKKTNKFHPYSKKGGKNKNKRKKTKKYKKSKKQKN